jgi:hypothetical protein
MQAKKEEAGAKRGGKQIKGGEISSSTKVETNPKISVSPERVVFEPGSIEQHKVPVLPSIFRRGQLISPREFMAAKKYQKEMTTLDEKLMHFAISNDGLNNDQAKEAKAKTLSNLGKGYEYFCQMFEPDGSIKPKYKNDAENLLNLARSSGPVDGTIFELLEGWSKLTPEPLDSDTRDVASGQPLYIKGSTTRELSDDITGRLLDEAKKTKLYVESEKVHKNGKVSHEVFENRYDDLVKKRVDILIPTSSEKERIYYYALFKAIIKGESGFKPWSLSVGKKGKSAGIVFGAGLGQIHADVINDQFPKINPFIEEAAVDFMILEFLHHAKEYNGNIPLTLASYNWGNDHEILKKGLIDELKNAKDSEGDPVDVNGYVKKNLWNQHWYIKNGLSSKPPEYPEKDAEKVELSQFYTWLDKQPGTTFASR